jgi:hypothetical protein
MTVIPSLGVAPAAAAVELDSARRLGCWPRRVLSGADADSGHASARQIESAWPAAAEAVDDVVDERSFISA